MSTTRWRRLAREERKSLTGLLEGDEGTVEWLGSGWRMIEGSKNRVCETGLNKPR